MQHIQTTQMLLTQTQSHEEIFASTSWLLTVCQVLVSLGILGYGLVLTYMTLQLYRSHPEWSANKNIAWLIFVGFFISAIVINIILQYIKKAWLHP